MLISHGDTLNLPVEDINADEILTASGIFPLDEIPTEHLNLTELSLESTARQTVTLSNRKCKKIKSFLLAGHNQLPYKIFRCSA